MNLKSQKYQRKYLQPETKYNHWSKLSKFAEQLISSKINTPDELHKFLYKKNEIDVLVNQQFSWLKLQTYRYTNREDIKTEMRYFNKNVMGDYKTFTGIVSNKILNLPFLDDFISQHPTFQPMLIRLQNQSKTHCDKNTELDAQINELLGQYNKITAAQKIQVKENELSVFAAPRAVANFPSSERKQYALKIQERLDQDQEILNVLFDKMISIRNEIALNAKYDNYRDYIWDQQSRQDYSPEDCNKICIAIRDHFIPIHKSIIENRKRILNLDKFHITDLGIELGKAAAFQFPPSTKELISKVRLIFKKIHPDFEEMLAFLEQNNRLDFEKRPNKAMAMFSIFAPESRLPFAFYMPLQNVTDIHNSIHEITHSIHNLYNREYLIEGLSKPGSEASELFTLSIELISIQHWSEFIDEEQNLIRAQLKKLEHCLATFQMVGLWDSFQHWVYLNLDKTHEQRNAYWDKLSKEFDIGISDAKIKEPSENAGWQNRPLIFRAPFYLVEYAFAQLGAFEIYRQYMLNKDQTVANLIAAMKLGNTKPLKEIYKTAGVDFDFSNDYIIKIAEFLKDEYEMLWGQLKW